MPRILLNHLRNNLSIQGISLRHDELLDQPVRTFSDVTFRSLQVGDIFATGNVTFTGNITEIESKHVYIQDNIIDINADNENALLNGGIRVQRGAGLVPFDIFYNEPSQLLRIGFENNLQAVATRQDNPTDGYLAVWNASDARFDARNVLGVPFEFQSDVTFHANLTLATTSNDDNPYITGDAGGNLVLASFQDIVLGAELADPGKSIIVPSGRKLNFGTSYIHSDAFGNLVLDSSKIVLPTMTFVKWGGNASVSSDNSGDDLMLEAVNINLNPGTSISVNTSAPLVHAGIATFQPQSGGNYSVSSVGDLQLSASKDVVLSSMSLNRLAKFTTDITGNMSIESSGDMFFSPAGNFVLNPNKSLCVGGKTTMSLVVDSNSGNFVMNSETGILLNANPANGVIIPTNVPLNIGTNGSFWEDQEGTTVISSTRDIAFSPGTGHSIVFPPSTSLVFGQGEQLSSDGSVLTISATSQINLAAPLGVTVGVNIPIYFGDGNHRIFTSNTNDLYVDSSHQIRFRATDRVVIEGSTLQIGATVIYQDVDNALTLYSGTGSNVVKTPGSFFAVAADVATPEGTGSLMTNGGLFVGKNIVVTQDSMFYSTVNVANVVTMDNANVPILVNNASTTDGTAIGFTSTWDFTGGYNIGRGTPDIGGGRSMVFTLPSFQSYGIGVGPSFFFGSANGAPYMVLDDVGLNLPGMLYVGNASETALVVEGNMTANAATIADTFAAGNNSFTVSPQDVAVSTGLRVNNALSVSFDNFNQPLLLVDNTGNTVFLPTLFHDDVTVDGMVTISGKLTTDSGISLGGDLDLQNNRIRNLQNPVYDNDPATKYYVDTFLQGLSAKEAVDAATTGGNLDLTSPIYNIDDVALPVGSRLLIKDQTNAVENGIYVLDADNVPIRSIDMPTGTNVSGASVFVISGTLSSGVGYLFVGNPIVVDQDALVIRPFTGASQINVGAGLSKNGNTLSVNVNNVSISLDAGNNLQVAPSFISNVGLVGGSQGTAVATSSDQSHVTKLGTITKGTWNADVLTVPYGGTGVASLPGGRLVVGNNSAGLTTTDKIYIDPVSNYVGLQTTSPTSNLHILNPSGSTSGTWLRIEDNGTLTQSSGLSIASVAHAAKIALQSNGTLYIGQEDFTNASNVTISTQRISRISVDYNGNVVIGNGVVNPGHLLTVYGKTYLNGATTIKGDVILPTLTISSDALGNVVLDSPVVKISNGFDVGADATIGNVKFLSTTAGKTGIVSADRNTGVGLPLYLGTSSSNVSAVCMSGGLLVPDKLQIGGTVGDASSGFSLYTLDNNLHFAPGTMGGGISFDAPMSFGAGLSLYDVAKPNDFVNISVSTTFMYLQTNTTTVSAPYTVRIGGGTNEIITTLSNKQNSASITYDPTDVSEYAGGSFAVSPGILTTIGSELRLKDLLRFHIGNGTEGSLGANGWYYLGTLGIGRTTLTASLSWRIRLDYDGLSPYSVSIINYDRNVVSLMIFANAGSYYLFLRVLSGPCRVSILESPVKFYLNGNYEGGAASPTGEYSGYNQTWTLDFDSGTSQSNAVLDLSSINVLSQATLNNARLQGQTVVTGDVQVTGNSTFIGDTVTFSDPVTSLPKVTMRKDTDNVSNVVVIHGDNATSPGFLIDRGLVSGSLSMIPSTSSTYAGALLLSHNTNDPSSQILLATRGNPAVLIDNNGNTQIVSTMESIESGAVALRVKGGALFDRRVQFNAPVLVSELRVVNSTINSYVPVICDNSANLSVSGSRITNVGNPVDVNDAVNMGYVQGLIQGLSTKESAIAASAGVNYDISNVVTVVDGVTLSPGHRILLKDQSNQVENGIYIVQYGMPPVRSEDLDVGSHAAATYVFVSQGSINFNSGWLCSSTPGQDVVGVNSLTFTQFSGAGQFLPGAALSKIGNTFSVSVDDSSIEVAPDNSLRVKSAIAGTGLSGGSGSPLSVASITHLNALGTITTGTWNANIIGMSYGGTGASTFAVGRIPFSNGVSLTQGNLYFDASNVRLGINTTSPTSGLTLQDRDISIVQSVATSSSILLTSSVTNYTFGIRNELSKMVLSGGTGNNKAALTDMVTLDSAGVLTASNGVKSGWITLNNSTRLSSDTLESLNGGAFSMNVFSMDNTGAYFNFYGGMGTSTNRTNSEFMRVGFYNANYLIQTSATGTGTVRNLCLQSGSNTNQLVLMPNGNIVLNGPVYINATTDATSINNGGSLTILGGATVGSTLYARTFVCTSTSDGAATVAGGIAAGKVIVSGAYQDYVFSADSAGDCFIASKRTATDSVLNVISADGNNANNVQLRIFGAGKSVVSTAEWMEMGFDSASVQYSIRTAQGGAASPRSLVLSATPNMNQIILGTDGTMAIASVVTFADSVVVSSTLDAAADGTAALKVAGGLAVDKSVMVGSVLQTASAQVTNTLDFNASGSLDKISMSYTSPGRLNVFSNATATINIHSGNSSGPSEPNQEKLVLGYLDASSVGMQSFASGTGIVKDLVVTTGGNDNQLRLYASDGSVRFSGDVYINSTTEADGSGTGALRIAGGLSTVGFSNFFKGVTLGTAGQPGTMLTLSGASSWAFSSIDSDNTYLQPISADSTLCITNAASTPLVTFDAKNATVTTTAASCFANLSNKALSIQNNTGIDMFMFDTVNHVLNVQNGRITNLAYPQLASDAANKAYVDNLIKGLNLKEAAHVAADANVDLTKSVTVLDGVTLQTDYRVLLMLQSNAVENGLYTVVANNMLTRTDDMATGSRAAGAFCFVQMGDVRGDKGYVCITNAPNDIVGINSLAFSQFNGNVISAGLGLYKDGNNVLNVNLDPESGLAFNGNLLRVDPAFAGSGLQLSNGILSLSPITAVATILSGTWEGSTVETAFGGTGNTGFENNGIVFSDGTKLLTSAAVFSWDDIKGSLGINGIGDPLSAGDGLTVAHKDIAVQGVDHGMYLTGDDGAYKWSMRQISVKPLNTLQDVPNAAWKAVNMSKDGKMIVLLSEPQDTSYISADGGYNWEVLINDGAQHAFGETALSYDGSTILVCASNEYLYVSRDAGVTFERRMTDSLRVWEWCSISDNGQYMLASALGDGMFASNDSGQTWTLIANVPTDPVDLSFLHVTKDGSIQFAGYSDGGNVYASTDYGTTFALRNDMRVGNWYDMAEAESANVLVLFENPGSLFVSTNLGVTWTEKLSDTARHWVSVSISSDGSTMAAADDGGNVHLSSDFGSTWTTLFGGLTSNWQTVVVAKDHLGVMAAGTNVPVYITKDAGATYSTVTTGNVTVSMLALSPAGLAYIPVYNGGVLRYFYNESTSLVFAGGNSTTKTNLTDLFILTDGNHVGIGYDATDAGIINETLDVNGTMAVQGKVTFGTPLSVASGGTGTASLSPGLVISDGTGRAFASTGPLASGQLAIGAADNSGSIVVEGGDTLRSHLGLGIGTDVQAWNVNLDSISGLTPSNNYFIMGNGTSFVMGTAETAAASMGLGSLAYLNNVNDAYWSGTALSVSHGGTGATAFTAGTVAYYDGTSFKTSSLTYDATNVGLSVNGTTVPNGSGLGVYGSDVSLLAKIDNSTPSSILFHNADGAVAWKIQRKDDGLPSGTASLVVSGGIPSADKNALTDRLTILSTGEMVLSSTTDSTAIGTGALQISGGLSVQGKIYAGGIMFLTNTADEALVVSGGASFGTTLTSSSLNVSGDVAFTSTRDASSASTAGTIVSGGMGVTGKIWNTGGIVVERSSLVGARASGVTVSYDGTPWTLNTAVTDADRHLSLVSNVASSATYLNMRNLSATNGWDLVVEGDGNNRFIWQSSAILDSAATTWMSLDSTDGNLTLYSTTDASSSSSGSLYTHGGIFVAKSVVASGLNVASSSVDGAVGVNIANTNVGTLSVAQLGLNNDGVDGASLFLNSSGKTADGGANGLTLRNNAGLTRIQSKGGLGLTLASTNGNAMFDGTLTVSSTTDATSSADGGSTTVLGGLAVGKSAYIGGNLTVSGTVTVSGAVTAPTLTTTVADMVNVSTLTVKSARMVVVNEENMLYVTFKVIPTEASLNTQFTFVLPGRTTVFTESLDLDNGQCSGFTDSTNLVVLQNVLCTGVAASNKAVVKFQSVSTNTHYLQAFVAYAAV